MMQQKRLKSVSDLKVLPDLWIDSLLCDGRLRVGRFRGVELKVLGLKIKSFSDK